MIWYKYEDFEDDKRSIFKKFICNSWSFYYLNQYTFDFWNFFFFDFIWKIDSNFVFGE
jgi:hypothetical protein